MSGMVSHSWVVQRCSNRQRWLNPSRLTFEGLAFIYIAGHSRGKYWTSSESSPQAGRHALPTLLNRSRYFVERYMQNSELVIIPVLAPHRYHLGAVTPAPPRQVSLHFRSRNELRAFAPPRYAMGSGSNESRFTLAKTSGKVVKREVGGNECQKVRR